MSTMKHSTTFSDFCKKVNITNLDCLKLMDEAVDLIDFCALASRMFGVELTTKEVSDIYHTAPKVDMPK